jgi:adenylylsulfate kinase
MLTSGLCTNCEKVIYVPKPLTDKKVFEMEKPIRSFAKAVSWRIVATLTTVILVIAFSKNWELGGIVGIAELVSKTVIYYVHERVWNFLNFGRERKAKR